MDTQSNKPNLILRYVYKGVGQGKASLTSRIQTASRRRRIDSTRWKSPAARSRSKMSTRFLSTSVIVVDVVTIVTVVDVVGASTETRKQMRRRRNFFGTKKNFCSVRKKVSDKDEKETKAVQFSLSLFLAFSSYPLSLLLSFSFCSPFLYSTLIFSNSLLASF